MNEWIPVGLTAGQAERLRGWLLHQATAAEQLAEKEADAYAKFYRGQAYAWRSAERAMRVASVGAL